MVANIGPAMLCHTAANTLGSAATGPKCAVASATPKPEFCIPTSIEIALLVPSSSQVRTQLYIRAKTESIMEHHRNKDKKS